MLSWSAFRRFRKMTLVFFLVPSKNWTSVKNQRQTSMVNHSTLILRTSSCERIVSVASSVWCKCSRIRVSARSAGSDSDSMNPIFHGITMTKLQSLNSTSQGKCRCSTWSTRTRMSSHLISTSSTNKGSARLAILMKNWRNRSRSTSLSNLTSTFTRTRTWPVTGSSWTRHLLPSRGIKTKVFKTRTTPI